MTREQNIPLFLWIATAVLAHLAWGGGADKAAKLIEQQLDVGQYADRVGGYFGSGSGGDELEVSLLEIPVEEPKPAADDEETAPENDEEPKEKSLQEAAREKPDDVRPEDEPEKAPPPIVAAKKPEEKKPAEEKKPEEKKAPEVLPDPKGRVSIQQHQEQDDPEDNPEAEFMAEKARKVAEQTQARITSTDRNDPEPTPGGNHSSAADNPGNADETDVKQSEDSAGEMAQAPNDKATTPKPGDEASSTPRTAGAGRDDLVAKAKADPDQRDGKDTGDESDSKSKAAAKGQDEEKAASAVDGSPDLVTSPDGSEGVAPGSKAKKARKGKKARKRRLPPPRGRNRLLGFGAGGKTKDGVNLNLQQDTALDVMGRGELARMRKLDGERRRSKHRGSWTSVGLERWKSAIENYVAKVKPGNQTALNAARVPFARYLNEIHNRLHPVFADSFLGSLSRLPADHPMNRSDLRTNLEIIVSRTDGRLVDMGITRASGVTAFDVAALEAVKRSSPFGTPPQSIVSPDGNVYLHWEFYRDPWYACSTYFARPFILKASPGSKPPNITPPTFGPREESPGRQGFFLQLTPPGFDPQDTEFAWAESAEELRRMHAEHEAGEGHDDHHQHHHHD